MQLQIPLISLTHYIQIVSSVPSAVSWSYKSPQRCLFYILHMANPSVLPVLCVPQCSGCCCEAGTFSGRTADSVPLPSVPPERHKRCGYPSLATFCGHDCSFHTLAPILFQIFMEFWWAVLCGWASCVPWCCWFRCSDTHFKGKVFLTSLFPHSAFLLCHFAIYLYQMQARI